MEPANGCRICMEAFLGSVKTPWFGLREGSVIPVKKTAEPSTARHPTSNSTNHRRQGYSESKTYPVVIRSAVHAATRCALAITALHPGFNLRNLAYEEGKKRGSLQSGAQQQPRSHYVRPGGPGNRWSHSAQQRHHSNYLDDSHECRTILGEQGNSGSAAHGERRIAGRAYPVDGASERRIHIAHGLQRDSACDLCQLGTAASRDRHLWPDGVFGAATDAGDRHPHGAGSERAGRAQDGGETGHGAGVGRGNHRRGRGTGGDAVNGKPTLRRYAKRPDRNDVSSFVTCWSRSRRHVPPGAPSFANGSGGVVAVRITNRSTLRNRNRTGVG